MKKEVFCNTLPLRNSVGSFHLQKAPIQIPRSALQPATRQPRPVLPRLALCPFGYPLVAPRGGFRVRCTPGAETGEEKNMWTK